MKHARPLYVAEWVNWITKQEENTCLSKQKNEFEDIFVLGVIVQLLEYVLKSVEDTVDHLSTVICHLAGYKGFESF